MRAIGLDVHQSFCEVAICEGGEARSAGRVLSGRAELELFAQSLDPGDRVVMEATGPAFEIARILEPHVAEVVVVNAADVRAISHAKVKSDRFDAWTLARLLDAGLLDSVWVPSAEIGALRRRVARRAALVRQRTRAKNEVHASLSRSLLGKSPASDLFGRGGRKWLAAQPLNEEEAETVSGCLRQIDFLDAQIEAIDRKLAKWALGIGDKQRGPQPRVSLFSRSSPTPASHCCKRRCCRTSRLDFHPYCRESEAPRSRAIAWSSSMSARSRGRPAARFIAIMSSREATSTAISPIINRSALLRSRS